MYMSLKHAFSYYDYCEKENRPKKIMIIVRKKVGQRK